MPPDGDVTNHQIEKPRTSRAMKSPVGRADPLSIEALARYRQACDTAHDDIHDLPSSNKQDRIAGIRCDNAISLLDERDTLLRDLISTLPARTLADVVVQVALIQVILDQHSVRNPDSDESETVNLAGLLDDINRVLRLAASIFPVVAAASGVDPAGLVDPWAAEQWDRHFGPIAETLGGAA